MKLLKRPKPLFKGERVVAVDPPFATHISERWNRRIHYYSGRTLTHTALNVEQQNHSSHLSLYAGQLSPGVVQGLEISLERSGVEVDEQRYLIQPGGGIDRNGEDINLSQPMLINVDQLPVAGQLPTDTTAPQGIGIIVLQAVVADSAGDQDDEDPCEIDPANDAFEDWQVVDGLRAIWYPWPEEWDLPLVPSRNRIRNRLAYIIYDEELKANGMPLPWENQGVALALVSLLNDGQVEFIDQHAVVRQGGIPNPRQSLIANTGTPFLWQARILGLSAHMQALRDQGLDLKQALSYFQYLPPVGVLPPDIVDFNSQQSDLLPSQYRIEAVPVPLEQFELAVEASASAEAFNLFVPDRIKVLVPVPQQFYEPRLLKRESVDPIFQQTIDELLLTLGGELGRRQALRSMSTVVIGAMDKDLLPVYPAEDPEAVPGETANNDYKIHTQHDTAALAEVTKLYDWLVKESPLSVAERDQIKPDDIDQDSFIGVKKLIVDLQEKIDKSNHKIDFGFLRVQTDIYRFRQMMLGNVEATRLATSPVLANIAQGLSSNATQQNLTEYFESIKPAPVYQMNTAGTAGVAGASAADVTGAGSVDSGASTNPAFFMMRADTADMGYAESTLKDVTTGKKSARVLNSAAAAERSAAGSSYYAATIPPGGYSLPQTPDMTVYQPYVEAYFPSSDDVESKSPIIGESLEFRSTSVAERISDPPAPEARSYAVASKAAVYSDLIDMDINIEGIDVPLSGSESAVISSSDYNDWYKNLEASDGENAVLSQRVKANNGDVVMYLGPFTDAERKTLGDRDAHLRASINQFLGKNKRALNTPGLAGMILSGLYDPHPNDGDEGAFLSVGVSALESTVSTLRKVERRINGYKKAVVECKKSLEELQKIAGAWAADINDSQDNLREHRHDVTVTRALLQEEEARIAAINTRRQEILENHVSFIGYMRPRTISLRKDLPAIQIHGEFKDPVPACLKQDVAGPDELQDMVNLFRDIPLKWLPYSKIFLLKLDSYHIIKNVFQLAKQKAEIRIQATPILLSTPTQSQKSSSKYGQVVNNVIQSHKQSYLGFTQQKAVMDLNILEKMSWKEVSVKAEDELSLQDLIESGKGQSGLAQRATRELENIEDVAVCLYGRMAEVKPAQRLLWADLLSEFDQPVVLKNLEVLPQWDLVDFELRRDLQRLTQWLFSRVDNGIPDAVNLMNDLVRICILLASHAPVSAIVNGHLPKPVTGKIGDIVKLAVDKGLVRIGMQVGIFSGLSMAVQGIVEDLNADEASIKVTQSKQASYHLEEGARAQFYHSNTVLNLLA